MRTTEKNITPKIEEAIRYINDITRLPKTKERKPKFKRYALKT